MSATVTIASEEARLNEAGGWCLRLAEGELSAEERLRFDAWLDADPANREAFDDAVLVWRGLEAAAASPDLIAIRRAALDSFQRANRERWTRRLSHHWRPAAALAACLAMAVVFAAAWLQLAPKVYETGVGERRVAVLADGSKLSLDAATRVEVRYLRGRRELRLKQGRAKFDVAKDPLRPFSVAAGDKLVVATGTQFSVELLRRQVHVILYEGHVAVLARPSRGAPPAPLRLASRNAPADQWLTPGHELVATEDRTDARVAPTDLARALSWEGGQLVFADEPLASAVEQVNRYSQDKLAVGDPAAGAVRINGVFTAGDTAAFVEGVTGVAPVQAREVRGREVFFARR
jgi:transmembrane sensor